MKTKILLFSVLFSLIGICNVSAQTANDVLGFWLTQDGDSQVKIFKAKDGKYYGNIKWLKNPFEEDGSIKIDDENPNEKLRTRKILGLQLLKAFEFNTKKHEWEDGTIYDPKTGKTYSCFMWFENNDKKTLHVKGFIGFSLLGKEVEWKREKEMRNMENN
ncbi:MAG: DUF2147 domain-containing protein [Bacteroidetes bacterium]|nr:MAG: DUF2147 domain-containing protein [Bacteroidota bacterium]